MFALSICFLTIVQAALIAAPGRIPGGPLARARSRWWAILPPASIIVVIAAIAAIPSLASALTYIALVFVPPLAALALAALVRGARPRLALAAPPLFALAWAVSGTLVGEASALALEALACVALGCLLVAMVPRGLLRLGIYAMAVADAALVAADLLQHPNSVLVHAAPAAGLPRLQSVIFGSAAMGFGDLFIATTVGALLLAERRPRADAVAIAAIVGLTFNLLFLFVNELPATVPIAITLAIVDGTRAGAVLRRRADAGGILPREQTSRILRGSAAGERGNQRGRPGLAAPGANRSQRP